MKALTLTQPWATLVALGTKTLETRSWRTDYRGPLAIHAAKTIRANDREFCRRAAVAQLLRDRAIDDVAALPSGCVIATAVLRDVVPVGRFSRAGLSVYNLVFGDFSAGRFVWILDEARVIEPVPARGSLGLWEWQR